VSDQVGIQFRVLMDFSDSLGTDSSSLWLAGFRSVKGSPVRGGNTSIALILAVVRFMLRISATRCVRATISVGNDTLWTPTLFQKRIFMGTETGNCAVRVG